jgi:protein SCO1/2
MVKNPGFIWLLSLLGAIILGSAFLLIEPYKIKGSEITTLAPAPMFTLESSHGDLYSLKDHQGKFLILFFGYTYCPDICPTTLYKLKTVNEELGNNADEVEIVFVTVDPKRDTQEKLAKYLHSFDDSFFGLTGDEHALEQVWKDYGVFRQESIADGSKDYLVDHTTRLYLIDKSGNLKVTYFVDVTVSDLVSDIKYLIAKSG